nr:sigma-70 family RNA polymerase sigma factor [uncultured Anaerostipes sp.]
MFDKKSDYALNKHDQDSIIYISVSGRIRLTCADFSSEEEFLKWKAWSDEDYHETEKRGRSFNDKQVDLDDYLDVAGAVPSAEDEFFSELLKADAQAEEKALREKRLAALKAILNAQQYRRLWLYYAESKSVTEIAKSEGVTKASVSRSLARAIKKISKKFPGGPQK